MIMINIKRYLIYLLRWQASTPLITIVLYFLAGFDPLLSIVIANLIGGLIFFWIDKFILTANILDAQWEVRDNVACVDCGKVARGYRLVRTKNYDRSEDINPQFRCEECSIKKSESLKKGGVEI